MKIRFSIRFLLGLTAAVFISFFAFDQWLEYHRKASARDWETYNTLVWGHANMDITRDYIVPKSIRGRLSFEDAQCFERFTTIDLRLDDMSSRHPEHLEYLAQYQQFENLHTVQLGHKFISHESLDVIRQFPALRTIEIWNYGIYIEEQGQLTDLTTSELDGIKVVTQK